MDVLNPIREDFESGAGFLARKSCGILRDLLVYQNREDINGLRKIIKDFCKELYTLRPSMVNINNTAALLYTELVRVLTLTSASDPIPALLKRIDEIILDEKKSVVRSAFQAAELIPEGASILTHSKSLSVAKALDLANMKKIKVFTTESRPLLEGQKMAQQLQEWMKIPTFVITEAEVSHIVQQVDMVLVGSDSILPDGSIVNKIGTSTIALCAQEYKKPFYSIGDRYKISSRKEAVSLEEAPSAHNPASFPDIKNVYFDRTAAHTITAVITEEGPVSAEQIQSTAKYWGELETQLLKA